MSRGYYGEFDDDLVNDDDNHDDLNAEHNNPSPFGPAMVQGSGQTFPTRFTPRNDYLHPMELFGGRLSVRDVVRCTLPNDSSTLLLMTDGACLNNGQATPKAGWAFFEGLDLHYQPLVISDRLEQRGPWGDPSIQTSNRAELRAVIAALRYQHWPSEGFRRIVIATDSEYVVEGSTRWARTWSQNGWRTSGNAHVMNRDLWEILLEECEMANRDGLVISFWKIPRNWNDLADDYAKVAAARSNAPAWWTD